MYACVFQVNMYSSVFSLTWMSLDRCMALTGLSDRALSPSASLQRARLACITIWVAACLLTLLPFGAAHARHGWGQGFCFAGMAEVQWLEVTVGFFLPFCIICVCYTLIGRVLVKTRSPAVAQRRGRLKALRMIVGAVTVFFVCWLPENVFISMHLLHGATGPSRRRGNSSLWQQYPLTGHLVTLAACTNSCLNPLLYSLIGGTFTHKLRLFIKHHARCNLPHHHATTHTHPTCPHRPREELRHSLVEGANPEGECVCEKQPESTSD